MRSSAGLHWCAIVMMAVCLWINRIENLIRPWALGRKNGLFSGSLAAGQRAADIMSLLQTAKLNGHEPMAYLKDGLERLPTHPYSRISELLPTQWKPSAAV